MRIGRRFPTRNSPYRVLTGCRRGRIDRTRVCRTRGKKDGAQRHDLKAIHSDIIPCHLAFCQSNGRRIPRLTGETRRTDVLLLAR